MRRESRLEWRKKKCSLGEYYNLRSFCLLFSCTSKILLPCSPCDKLILYLSHYQTPYQTPCILVSLDLLIDLNIFANLCSQFFSWVAYPSKFLMNKIRVMKIYFTHIYHTSFCTLLFLFRVFNSVFVFFSILA